MYTISQNPIISWKSFNSFLKEIGIQLNTSGGEIKTSGDQLLRQTSSVANTGSCFFCKSKIKSYRWELCGVCRAQSSSRICGFKNSAELRREHRREGFETANADRIFESTFTSQLNKYTFMSIKTILKNLAVESEQKGCSTGREWMGSGPRIASYSPVDGSLLGNVQTASVEDYDDLIERAEHAFLHFRKIPAPQRGELVRQFGNKLREKKSDLGQLVSWEMGKSLQEGLGEVQEMIDICDFAVGLSRQLHGVTMTSERPSHRLYEQYHPLGIVGIISAFNFPVAVWSWNVALAWVCGNVCVWKPSEKTPLCSIACQNIIAEVLQENNIPEGVSCVLNGGAEVGKWMAEDQRIALLSATGSTRMGKDVAQRVGARLGKSLLELGGNNAIIITPSADLDTAMRAAVFGAVGPVDSVVLLREDSSYMSLFLMRFLKYYAKPISNCKLGIL